MSSYIAAIDQGTTSTRCILFNHDRPVAIARREHRQIHPRPGWVEHDPLEIWNNTQLVIAQAIAAAGARPGQIAAVGITNQRETTVLWNKHTGQPVHNAIVWQDTRTQSLCDQLAGDIGPDRFRPFTGLPLATYFSGPKLQWLLDSDPALRPAALRGDLLFGTIDSWLIWNLTGGAHVTDITNASRTLLMNLYTLAWDDALLQAMNIPPSILPKIVPSSDPAGWGRTLLHGPFHDEILVCGNLGDQQAALVGQTCFEPGESKNTYGTGCFMLLNTGATPVPSQAGLLTTPAYQFAPAPAVYALEGSVAVAGALVQWLRDNLHLIAASSEIESLAQSVPDNGGVYFVPAFSGLFAPHWRPDARGLVAGLTAFSNRGHIARAALEATALQTLDLLHAMEKDSSVHLTSLKVDGGMSVNNLLMQFQADLLNVPVIRPAVIETTALGAAYAAGLAVQFWSRPEDLRTHWTAEKIWHPRMDDATRQHIRAQWHKAVERSLAWTTP